MTKRYAVWIEVEEITDEDTDHADYQTLYCQFGSSASFDNETAAQEFAKKLHEIASHC